METKFWTLITKKESESLEHTLDHNRTSARSKAYESKEQAIEKATQYIKEGRSARYYLMECTAVIQKQTPPVEVIETKEVVLNVAK